MRHIGVRALGVTAVLVCFVAAGCASTGAAPGSSHVPASPVASSPVGTSSPVTVSAPTSSEAAVSSGSGLVSATMNKTKADAEAARLLALAQVPPGATELVSAQAALSGPYIGTPATSSLIDHARYWRVSMSFADALAWVKAHPPSGLVYAGTGSGSGPGEQSGGYSYEAPDSPAWIGAEMQIGVESVSADVSDIRADGMTEWLDPVPVQDTATGPRMRVTVASGCPATDADDVGVHNDGTDLHTALLPPATPTGGLLCQYGGMNGNPFGLIKPTTLDATAAQQLAAAVNTSSLSHLDNVTTTCPAGDASLTVFAFAYPGRADVDVWYARTGCQWISNGYITANPSGSLNELANPAASGPPLPATATGR